MKWVATTSAVFVFRGSSFVAQPRRPINTTHGSSRADAAQTRPRATRPTVEAESGRESNKKRDGRSRDRRQVRSREGDAAKILPLDLYFATHHHLTIHRLRRAPSLALPLRCLFPAPLRAPDPVLAVPRAMLPTARVARSHLARSTYPRHPAPSLQPPHRIAPALSTTSPAAVRNVSSSSAPRLSRPSPRLRAAPAVQARADSAHRPATAAFFSSREQEADCAALKDVFDAPFSSSTSRATSAQASSFAPATGLFGSPSLPSPEAFVPLAQRTLVRAQLLVSRIVSAPQNGEAEMRRVVKNLDRLSDILCGVIDLAELVRNAHPDAQWRDAANQAYEGLCGFMNVLNTHTGLYEVSRRRRHAICSRPVADPDSPSCPLAGPSECSPRRVAAILPLARSAGCSQRLFARL